MATDPRRRGKFDGPGLDGPRQEALLALDAGEVRFDEPLAAWTALGVGGPAEALVRPRDADGWGRLLDWCRREKVPVTTLGRGFGLVVREAGVFGVAVVTDGLDRVGTPEEPGWVDAAWTALAGVEVEDHGGELWFVQAGAALGRLADLPPGLAERPVGTVGGALRRAGGDLRDRIAAVAVVGDRGRTRALSGERIDTSGNRLQVPRRAGIAAVAWRGGLKSTIDTEQADPADESGKIRLFRDPEGTTASSVLEALDVTGIRLREVVIDEADPNRAVNRGEGSATDLVTLAKYLKERAAKDAGVRLEEAFRIIGKK